MADILAILGVLTLIGLAFPGLLATNRALFPGFVGRAEERLSASFAASFWIGLLTVLVLGLPVLVLLNIPNGLFQFAGWVLIVATLLLSSLGGAALASLMGKRLSGGADSFWRGALSLELAIVFPILGWLFFWPFTLALALGSAVRAAWNRKPAAALTTPPAAWVDEPTVRPATPAGS